MNMLEKYTNHLSLMRFSLCVFIALFSSASSSEIYIIPDAPSVKKTVAYGLVDMQSGKILAAQNIDEKRPPASLVKIMTSYVAFKRIKAGFVKLDDVVLISQKARKAEGSRSFLEQGDRITLENLLKGMIVQSGNDASIAIAEHIAGDEETFVALMNHYSKMFGMINTHYTNSSGLPDPKQHTTVRDLATLSRALIEEFPVLYKWYKEKEFTYNNIKQKNRNKLLWLDESVDGIKTGYTQAAGYCLVSSSKQNDMHLISVVLNAGSINERLSITQKMLGYGFRFFETQVLGEMGKDITEASLYKSPKKSIKIGLKAKPYLTIARGQFKDIKKMLKIQKNIVAPVKKGEKLGYLSITLEDKEIATYPLVALEEAPLSGFFGRAIDTIKLMF